jgi:hypothetical protein
MAKETLNVPKLTRKAAVMLGIRTFLLGMGVETSLKCHYEEIFFFVKSKFTGVLQSCIISLYIHSYLSLIQLCNKKCSSSYQLY